MGNLSSTASSSTAHRKKYEVFLSFRGEDTRDGFTSHLFEALRQKQIETFIDNRLIRGDEISQALLRAIEESEIVVVVFSKDYASSKWCLRELAEVMKYKKLNEQIVIPVFYHVDPSDVRKQLKSFKYSFAKHENELQEEVQKWREALTEASNISGWDSSVIRPESTFVSEIVKDIWKKLNNISGSSDFPGLIGIDRHVERVISLLCLGVTDFGIVGIWGMGGIGKTTVADVVFQLISYQFENSYFVSCVRETTETNSGLFRLRDKIISKILNEENLEVSSPSIPQSIKSRLNHKNVLIVLDDVDKFRKLEVLVGGLDRFGPGSRIILTTRDRQVLLNSDLDDRNIYEIDGLNDDEALQLFCNNAFKQNHPTEDLIEVSKKIVNYANGNPLALKVLGSSLYRKSKREWESAVEKLQRILNPEILDVLIISYDGLDDDEKDLFLDMACFSVKGQAMNEDAYYPNLLSGREFSLRNLSDKSLIQNETLHDLLREMGREIVRRESPNKPSNRSRLWRQEDVLRTLKNDEGTDALQGISLNNNTMDVHLSSRVFEKMYNIKTLIITSYPYSFDDWGRYFDELHFPDGLDYLPDELRYLHWRLYPFEELPSCFNPVNLVELDLANSNIKQLWDGRKCLPKLKRLNLSYCKHLIRIPALSDIPSAEHIHLKDCISLLEIHSSTQCPKNLELMDCKNLKSLDLTGCISLTKFPQISGRYLNRLFLCGCSKLENLPPLSGLSSLTQLDLNNFNLREIPEDIGCLSSLLSLDLGGNGFESLPKSIKELSELRDLRLNNCGMLRSLTELPSGLLYLEARNCKQLIQFELYADGRGSLILDFLYCLKLDQKAAIKVFRESLQKMQLMMTEKVLPYRSVSIHLPGSEIPEWFHYKNIGSSIGIPALELLNDCGSNRYIIGFSICVVIGLEENDDVLFVNYDFHIETSDGHKEPFFDHPIAFFLPGKPKESIGSDHILLGCYIDPKCYEVFQKLDTLLANRSMGNYVGTLFEFHIRKGGEPAEGIKVKHCGIHPMYAQLKDSVAIDQDTEETCEPCPKRICTHSN